MNPIDLLEEQEQEIASSQKLDANRFLDYLDLAEAVKNRSIGPGYQGDPFKHPESDPLREWLDPVIPKVEVSRVRVPQTRFPLDTHPTLNSPLLEISDGRLWTPNKQIRDTVIGFGRLTPKPKKMYTRYDVNGRPHYVVRPSANLYYLDRTGAIPCIRRRVRKQVLFAKKKAGYMKMKEPRWTKSSYFIC